MTPGRYAKCTAEMHYANARRKYTTQEHYANTTRYLARPLACHSARGAAQRSGAAQRPWHSSTTIDVSSTAAAHRPVE
eukprot:5422218-Pyramimonas_sp.AAC.1